MFTDDTMSTGCEYQPAQDSPAIDGAWLRPAGLAQENSATRWLWHGYLAAGNITLFTSQWKSGKTTLVAVLLARMGRGGQLAGLPVAAGRAAVVSEESPNNWAGRCRKLGIGDHVRFLCRPFHERPTLDHWRGLVSAMLEIHRREGLDLVVIDPLAVFFPAHSENLAAVMMETILPLSELTARGIAVLLLHHPRKGKTRAGSERAAAVRWQGTSISCSRCTGAPARRVTIAAAGCVPIPDTRKRGGT